MILILAVGYCQPSVKLSPDNRQLIIDNRQPTTVNYLEDVIIYGSIWGNKRDNSYHRVRIYSCSGTDEGHQDPYVADYLGYNVRQLLPEERRQD